MYLSKSLYTRGIQCIKALWLKKYKKDILIPPSSSTEAIFNTGNIVGYEACKLFPDGKKVPYVDTTTFEEKVKLTKEWLDKGETNIYEATFEYDGIVIVVDILHINSDGNIEIFEVKSSTSIKNKKVYIDDASIQYYVLDNLGYKIDRTCIVHLNKEYIRGDELDIDELFSIVDIQDKVIKLQQKIPEKLNGFEKFLDDKDNEPNIDIGVHCNTPYNCDGIDYCWKHIPQNSIFDISGLRKNKKFKLYNEGIITFEQIRDYTPFSESQRIQIESECDNKSKIDKKAIKEFIDTLTYPIYYLDFETFQQAVPQWKGVNPYMQLPFQYSLHIEYEDGKLEHKEFLAKEGIDPRYEIAKRLVEDIPTNVTVLAYNMSFEKAVINKLAKEYKEFRDDLCMIHNNIKDLMIPFKSKYYYTPAMKGSYSIKDVLQALVPEITKSYKDLDGVQNGSDAMQIYAKLSDTEDKEKVVQFRDALLEYCKLDTFAMVEILKKLKETIN
jgi:hypothetical protein